MTPVFGDTRVGRAGGAERRGRPVIGRATDTFTLWWPGLSEAQATRPSATNTGPAAYGYTFGDDDIIAPANGTLTVGNGELVEGKVIKGFVNRVGTGRLKGCIIEGPTTIGSGGQRPLIESVDATPPAVTQTGPFGVEGCLLKPVAPSAYLYAFGRKYVDAYRCHIVDTVDYVGFFSQTADGLVKSRFLGNFGERMVQFQPDAANSNRSHTHNDAIQWQGNLDPASDVLVRGNTLYARLNPALGQPSIVSQYGPRNHVNGLTATPNTQAKCSGTVDRNWLFGGIQLVNLSGTAGGFTVTNNVLEQPGTHAEAPIRSLVVGQFVDGAVVSGNVYPDGTPVPRGTN